MKQMNITKKRNRLTDIENRIVVTRGEGADKRVKWVKGINNMVMDGN